MHHVIIVTLIVTACGREIPESYYPVPHEERYNEHFLPPPTQTRHNQNRQIFINDRERNFEINKINENRRNGGYETPAIAHGQVNDAIKTSAVNLAFERQVGQNRQGKINLPRQTFTIDAQYSNMDGANNERFGNNQNTNNHFNNFALRGINANNRGYTTNQGNNRRSKLFNLPSRQMDTSTDVNTRNNDDFKQDILLKEPEYRSQRKFNTCDESKNSHDESNNDNNNVRRNKPNDDSTRQHEMIFDNGGENNKRKSLRETNQNNSENTNVNNEGAIEFVNNDKNANKDTYEMSHNTSNKDIPNGLPNKMFAERQIPSKTTMENEVTSDPFQDDAISKENRTADNNDRWIWDGADKAKDITTNTPPTLDDRAAFAGDKCATGMARVAGMCVQKDT